MKKGIFKSLTALALGLSLIHLSGCAALLDLVGEEDADYDRGYAVEQDYEEECRGRHCHTDSDGDYGRSLASDSERELSDEDARVLQAIRTRDVILGMTRQDVMQSWGEPSQREVAGRGTSGHERWTYGSRYSLGETRTVIFENGKVAGWQR